jgi:hypothetical protein
MLLRAELRRDPEPQLLFRQTKSAGKVVTMVDVFAGPSSLLYRETTDEAREAALETLRASYRYDTMTSRWVRK